jgi:hypothetical protein
MEILIMAIIAAISGGGFGGIAMFARKKERQRNETKELQRKEQLALEASVEKYGHDIDIRALIVSALPVSSRKLEDTRWELKIDQAGASRAEETEHGKSVEARDSIVTLTLMDHMAANMEIDSRSYNLSRFFYKPDNKYMTYADAFKSNENRFDQAAKAVQSKMVRDISTWASKAQSDYEYESYVPALVHEYL